MTNSCVHRAERVAFLMLLSEEFPNFVRVNPPPSAKSQDSAPLADEAREFFASGQPEMADKYFPWLVNLMSPAYWIYLVMGAAVLLNAMGVYSRFRLWRIDANRALLEIRLKALAYPGLNEEQIKARAHSGITRDQIKALPPQHVIQTPQDRKAAEELIRDFDVLHRRCEEQLVSYVTPMGSEMYYRYQEWLIDEAKAVLAALLRSPSNDGRGAPAPQTRAAALRRRGFGRRWRFDTGVVGAGAGLHPLAQVRDQPSTRSAGQAAALMHDGKRQRDFLLIGDREPLQAAGSNVLGDHVARHVAPAEPGEQEIEPGRKIREPPDMTAEDSARQVLGERRAVGQHQLHMRVERFARERLGQGGKRMVGRHDWPHGDTRHELADEIARACGAIV